MKLFPGRGANDQLPSSRLVEYLNVDTLSWTRTVDMPYIVEGSSMFVVKNRLFVIGGRRKNGPYYRGRVIELRADESGWDQRANLDLGNGYPGDYGIAVLVPKST